MNNQHCANCGAPMDENTRFCGSCGAPPQSEQFSSTQPTPPPPPPVQLDPDQTVPLPTLPYQPHQSGDQQVPPSQFTPDQQVPPQPQPYQQAPPPPRYESQYQAPPPPPRDQKSKMSPALLVVIIIAGILVVVGIIALIGIFSNLSDTDADVRGQREAYYEIYEPEETPEPTPTPEPEETPEPTPTPEPEETPEPTPTPEPEETPEPMTDQISDELFVGTWYWFGSPYYVFNADGTGTMADSDIFWATADGVLLICITPILCNDISNCLGPAGWYYTLDGDTLILESTLLAGVTFTYNRR